MITPLDQQFLIWEKQNQPRRAKARTAVCSSDIACSSKSKKAIRQPTRRQPKGPAPVQARN